MTQVAEKPQMVLVACAGIIAETGFNLSPDGYEPTFVRFFPGKPTEVAKHYADYLVSMDSARFTVIETKKAKTETTLTDEEAAAKAQAKAEADKAKADKKAEADKKKAEAKAKKKAEREARKAAQAA